MTTRAGIRQKAGRWTMNELNRRTMLSSLLAMPFVPSIFRSTEDKPPAYERVAHEESEGDSSISMECPVGTIACGLGRQSSLQFGWAVMDGKANAGPGSGVDMSSRFRGNLCYFERVRKG